MLGFITSPVLETIPDRRQPKAGRSCIENVEENDQEQRADFVSRPRVLKPIREPGGQDPGKAWKSGPNHSAIQKLVDGNQNTGTVCAQRIRVIHVIDYALYYSY